MRQACMVANRVHRQQQVVHAYSIIVRTPSPAHPQGCFSSLPEIQTVLLCLHIFPSTDLPFQPDTSAESQSETEGSTLWPRPTFRQQAWQDLHENSAKLCREDDQVLFFVHVSQTSHNPKPLEAEGDINYIHFLHSLSHWSHTLYQDQKFSLPPTHK